MRLTDKNYYSLEANREYMSVSQYKQFCKCEAAAMAELNGEYIRPMTTALMVGSYVDAFFEGTLEKFKAEHPEIYKRDGTLKADFVQADKIIERCKADKMFMQYMSGKKQVIMTADLFGTPWKIKIDSYCKDKIVDLKIVRSMERIYGVSFVEHWGYDFQTAIYAEAERLKKKRDAPLETYLAVATKEEITDLELIHIPWLRHRECLEEVEKRMPRILAVKRGEVEPERCGRCEYCRKTKVLKAPIEYDEVGIY